VGASIDGLVSLFQAVYRVQPDNLSSPKTHHPLHRLGTMASSVKGKGKVVPVLF